MANVHNIECNMCGKLLRGRRGVAWIERDHIGLKGALVQQTFNNENEPDHYYITENQEDMHHFCDFDCLVDFADHRKQRYELVKQKQMRDEVNRRYQGGN